MKIARAVNWRYALGELVIVVVGILVAVQIDRWNTAREQSDIAQTYLVRLARDVEANSDILRSNVDLLMRWSENTDRLLLWIHERNDPPPDDSLVATVNGSRGGALNRLRSSTYTDLVSSGNLALFEDLDLRDAIVSYYESVPDAVDMVIDAADRSTAPLYPALGRHLDERMLYGRVESRPTSGLFVTDWGALSGDPEVALRLRRWAPGAYNSAEYFGELKRETDAVLERLAAARRGS